MDKFTTNQFAEETTAADIYAMREEFRQEEQELAEIADAQWEAFQDDHESEYEWTEEAIAWEEGMHPDNLYDGEPVMDLPDDLYMIFDDPDYWG